MGPVAVRDVWRARVSASAMEGWWCGDPLAESSRSDAPPLWLCAALFFGWRVYFGGRKGSLVVCLGVPLCVDRVGPRAHLLRPCWQTLLHPRGGASQVATLEIYAMLRDGWVTARDAAVGSAYTAAEDEPLPPMVCPAPLVDSTEALNVTRLPCKQGVDSGRGGGGAGGQGERRT